jgi:hypothetical protein
MYTGSFATLEVEFCPQNTVLIELDWGIFLSMWFRLDKRFLRKLIINFKDPLLTFILT